MTTRHTALRLLMISDVYHPRVNGVSTSIATFRRFLQAKGHTVTLIVPAYPGHVESDPDIWRVPSYYLPRDPEDRLLLPTGIMKLRSRIVAGDFDLIHVHTPFAAHRAGVRLARMLGIPVVETYHTYFEAYLHHYVPLLPQSLLKFFARQQTRRQAQQVDRLIVPSSAMRDVMHAYGVNANVTVLPTGLDLAEFTAGDRQAFCHKLGIDPSRRLLIYVGRVAHEKNIELLLEVTDKLRHSHPDVLLVVAGEGPARSHLKAISKQRNLQDHVCFIGYLERGQALWDCYASGHVFVFASTTETQGLVLLEAMAMGIPVVGVPALGARDVLREGAGALLAPAVSEPFAQSVQRLLDDPVLHAQLSARAREYATGWSNLAMTDKLLDIYQTLVAEPEPNSAVTDSA